MFLTVSEFSDFLEASAGRFPTKLEFARAIGITPSRFSRALRGDYALNVLNCLRLAKATGESASHVLRLAGKRDIAEMLEDLFGRRAPALSPAERELLTEWERLSPRARQALRSLMNDLLPQQKKRAKTA